MFRQPRRHIRQLPLPQIPMAQISHLPYFTSSRRRCRFTYSLRQLQKCHSSIRGRKPINSPWLFYECHGWYLLHIPSVLYDKDWNVLLRIHRLYSVDVFDLRTEG